jgi:hypothetical protein
VAEELELCLARAIEVSEGEALRHGMTLSGPAWRLIGAERTPTPLRFFCLPFEDLLTLDPRPTKQKGRIARDSIAPIWIWLSGTLLPFETKSYCRNFKSAIVAADHAMGKAHAAEFWRIAAAAMRMALASESGRKAARQVLKSELVIADAEEVALLLASAPTIMTVRELMVRPVPELTDEMRHSLHTIDENLVIAEPEVAPYIGVIAMNRLARPWEALKLRRHAADLVGEIIFGDIERYSSTVRGAHHRDFDVDALLDSIARFATFYDGIVEQDDDVRNSKLRRHLSRERATLGGAADGFMRRAPGALAEALRRPEVEKVELALRHLRLVAACKPFANVLGASVGQAEEVMCRMLLSHNEHLIRARNSRHDGRDLFATAVKFTSILFGTEHGEFLRRRLTVDALVA